jgi:hypothetical protein
MVRRISGKHLPSPIKQLNINNTSVEDIPSIANTLGSTFAHNSSTAHYTQKFQNFKTQAEKQPVSFRSDNSEAYNLPFSTTELEDALRASHDTAVGPDEVHYQMLKHLPYPARNTPLHLFNNIWSTGSFPPSWSEATVIPIPKPSKDSTNPSNYRPIALISCLCKTFERMVNNRLMWYLESNNILTAVQSGFRKGHSTTDQLIRFEAFVREAFVRREHVVSVFFDLEKAYDTTWKHGILQDLRDAGLRGRMPVFISRFLSNRQFRVRVGSHLSDVFRQEMGVP